ncbi:MAG: phosphate ABC transporter permease PstA, partial [Alphaproteobacteria bacterium]|nr:phosphate ABC transporter permease PstA [Alphaproteobacteria bacterium]
LYASRRRSNFTAMTLCLIATGIGIIWLFLILFSLILNGLPHLSFSTFVEMTPPPGETGGGLANSIFGTLLMTFLGVGVGAPIGVMAGTYLAEYGRYSKATPAIRFINDILLSAPSIIIGLFIYGLVVLPMKNFSALAGALALAVIVIPIVVRTTEDMLLLVPNTLREAASSMGLPRSHVVWHVAYRAARAGILTGILLGVARIAGETAPLLFTAFSNNFWSASLLKPIASLPTTINSFINTPDANMKELAWTGALIVTLAVLGLNIAARVLGVAKKQQ